MRTVRFRMPRILRGGSVFLAVALFAVMSHWPGTGPVVATVGASPDDLARLEAALGMFEAAGLSVGSTEVRFVEPGVGGCGDGWVGQYRSRWPRSVVTVCTDSQRTLVHELAHVWVDHHLSRRDQERLVELWRLPAWRGEGVAWGERASEHAAEIIVWGVIPGAVPRVPETDPDMLSTAYIRLTGRAPAAGFGRPTE
ncbi:MAG: hypothetical protein ACRDXD_06580 [Acidimicrobiia bacterium]